MSTLKKIYILLVILVINISCAMADAIPVESLSDFSTANNPKMISVRLLENVQLDKYTLLKKGYIVQGKITDIREPHRLKRDASFSFVPLNFQNESDKIINISNYYVARYTTKIDTSELAKSAALGIGNHFVKGISMGVRAVEGAVENEEGNRIKSSAVALYENSPVSYIEKGEDVVISKGEIFYLKFKI